MRDRKMVKRIFDASEENEKEEDGQADGLQNHMKECAVEDEFRRLSRACEHAASPLCDSAPRDWATPAGNACRINTMSSGLATPLSMSWRPAPMPSCWSTTLPKAS